MAIIIFDSDDHTRYEFDRKLYPPGRHFTAKIQLGISGELRTIVYTKKKDVLLVVPIEWGREIFEAYGLVEPEVCFEAANKGYFECSIDSDKKLVVHAYQNPRAKW